MNARPLVTRPITVKRATGLAFVEKTHRKLPRVQGAMWGVSVLDALTGDGPRDAFRDQAIRFTAWKTAREVLSYSPDVRYALRFARQSPEHRDATEEDLVRLFNQHGAEAISMLSQLNSSKPPHRSRHNQESIHAVG